MYRGRIRNPYPRCGRARESAPLSAPLSAAWTSPCLQNTIRMQPHCRDPACCKLCPRSSEFEFVEFASLGHQSLLARMEEFQIVFQRLIFNHTDLYRIFRARKDLELFVVDEMKHHTGIKHGKLDVRSRNVGQDADIIATEVLCKTKDILVIASRVRDKHNQNVAIQFRVDDPRAVQFSQTNLMTTAAGARNRRVVRSEQTLNRDALEHPRRVHHNICN